MPLQLTFCTHIIHSKNAKYHSLLMLSRQISDIVFPVSSCKSINFWYSSSVIRTWNRRSFEPFFLLPFFIRSSPPLRKIKESDLGIEPRTSHFHVCSATELIIFFHKTPWKFRSKRRALVRTLQNNIWNPRLLDCIFAHQCQCISVCIFCNIL